MKKYSSPVSLFFLFIFLCMSSCQSGHQQASSSPLEIALKQIDETGRKLEKAYDIHPIGEGMQQQFLNLEISFEVFRKMSKDEARELLLTCAQEFMDDINANNELRPYLLEYPFTLANVGIAFYIWDNEGGELYHPDICVAVCSPNGLRFRTNDPENEFKYIETTLETHEEAIALIKASQ